MKRFISRMIMVAGLAVALSAPALARPVADVDRGDPDLPDGPSRHAAISPPAATVSFQTVVTSRQFWLGWMPIGLRAMINQ
jgi:hypothetical protein